MPDNLCLLPDILETTPLARKGMDTAFVADPMESAGRLCISHTRTNSSRDQTSLPVTKVFFLGFGVLGF